MKSVAKRSWRRRTLSDDKIRSAMADAGGNVSRAAAALEVNRSTLHRWLDADPSLRPTEGRHQRRGAGGKRRPGAGAGKERSPDAWARAVRRAYELTATEEQLLDLAVAALRLARDVTLKPGDRMAAAGRYQQLVKQLDLEQEEDDGQASTTRPTSPPTLRRIK